jgi:hypothetical protein
MRQKSSRGAERSLVGLLLGLVVIATPGYGAEFHLGTLIRIGSPGSGVGQWDIAAGDSSGAVATDVSPYWQNNQQRLVEIEYRKPTNTVQVRVYEGTSNLAGQTFNQVLYNPTGGAGVVAAATWTISASSFFVTATSGPIPPSSTTLSNIALTGLSGALVLQPLLQTTLAASRGAGGATNTVTQSQDIVFQGDSTGSWRLTGNLRFTGLAGPVGATGNNLFFGLVASADDAAVPEPSAIVLTGLGLAALGLVHRRKSIRQ